MYDVAIIGGGPAGSTAGSILMKYNPQLKVVIFEREEFPRDHVGESQLPPISRILDEIGCWDKVEAANFPVKIGATYRWGKSPELWDFEFYPSNLFVDEPRPAKYEGQRKYTAFQVDRATYDNILLNHAESLGCEVRQRCHVAKVLHSGDHVDGLQLDDGSVVEARYYLDGSGHSGLLRRALGIKTEAPTSLQNIAIWDYWQNTDWAVEIGVGGTRVQVMSLGYGWIWFIPLGPTRTSIGLIVPASYYKSCGMKYEELYLKALNEDPLISNLITNAKREMQMQTTNDWSFLAERHVGENWFLIGESSGFADPILAAGMSLAQASAREAGITILELDRKKHPVDWLKDQFESRQLRRLKNHIRFADYWYTANEQFSDLKEFTRKIASENGLDMSPEQAWAWLGQGGFINDNAAVGLAGFAIDQVKAMHGLITEHSPEPILAKTNHYKLNLSGANWHERPNYGSLGEIIKYECYERNGKVLPLVGVLWLLVDLLEKSPRLSDLLASMAQMAKDKSDDPSFMESYILAIPDALEGLIVDGWVEATYDPAFPLVPPPQRNTGVQWNTDEVARLKREDLSAE